MAANSVPTASGRRSIMADAPTVGSVLANVVPVLIGGVLTFLGGAVTQWYLQTTKTAEDRRAKRIEKFEAMFAAVYAHEHWLDEIRIARAFGEGSDARLSPLTKVQALCAIHFPQLESVVSNLDVAARQYEAWMLAAQQKRLDWMKALQDAQQAQQPQKPIAVPDLNAGFNAAYQPYLSSRSAAIKAMTEFAQREFGETAQDSKQPGK
jgi:hypothetical protein